MLFYNFNFLLCYGCLMWKFALQILHWRQVYGLCHVLPEVSDKMSRFTRNLWQSILFLPPSNFWSGMGNVKFRHSLSHQLLIQMNFSLRLWESPEIRKNLNNLISLKIIRHILICLVYCERIIKICFPFAQHTSVICAARWRSGRWISARFVLRLAR